MGRSGLVCLLLFFLATAALAQDGFTTCFRQGTDVIFVVDKSGSVGSDNFVKVRDFMVNAVEEMDIHPVTGSQVGVNTFNSMAYEEFRLNKYSTKADIQNAINQIICCSSSTNIASGMDLATAMFDTAKGGRTGVDKVMIVLTDGRDSTAVATERAEAAALGIRVFAIGVGSNVDNNQLNEIAGDPAQTLTVGDFNQLGSFSKWICETAAKVNCQYSAYGDWSECSAGCGEVGERVRTRGIAIPADYGGTPCDENALSETRSCDGICLPVDCEYSAFSDWSDCSVTCGEGFQTRSRTVTAEGANGGQSCDPEGLVENQPCGAPCPCIVDPCVTIFTGPNQSGNSALFCGKADRDVEVKAVGLNNIFRSVRFDCSQCRLRVYGTTLAALTKSETLYSYNGQNQNLAKTDGSSLEVEFAGPPKCNVRIMNKCGQCPCIKAYTELNQVGPYYRYCGDVAKHREIEIDATDGKLKSFEFDCGSCNCSVTFFDGLLPTGAHDTHYSWNGQKANIKWAITSSLQVQLQERICTAYSYTKTTNQQCGCPCIWVYDQKDQQGKKMRICEQGSYDEIMRWSNFHDNMRSFEFDCGACECRASFYDGIMGDGAYDIFHSWNGLKRNMINLLSSSSTVKVEFWEDVKPQCTGFGSAYDQCGCPCVKVYKEQNQQGEWIRHCETTAWDIDIIPNGYEPNMESFEFDCGSCDCKVTFWDHWVNHGTSGGGAHEEYLSTNQASGNLAGLRHISSTLITEFTDNCQYADGSGNCAKPCVTVYKADDQTGQSVQFCGSVSRDDVIAAGFNNLMRSFAFNCNGKPCRVAFYADYLEQLDRTEVHYSHNGDKANLASNAGSSLKVEFVADPVCRPDIKAQCGQCPCLKLYKEKGQVGPYVRHCGQISWDRTFYRDHIVNKIKSFEFDCGSCDCMAIFWDGRLTVGGFDPFYSWNGLAKDNSWSVSDSAEVYMHPGKVCKGQNPKGAAYQQCGCPCIKAYKELDQQGDYMLFCGNAPHDSVVRYSGFDNTIKSLEFDCGTCDCRASFYDGYLYDGSYDIVHSWNGLKQNLDMRVASSLKVEFWDDVKRECHGFGKEYDQCGCPCVKVYKALNQQGEWIRFCETTGWDTDVIPNGYEPNMESFEFDCGGCDCKATFVDHWVDGPTGAIEVFYSTNGTARNLAGIKHISSSFKVEFVKNCVQ